MIVVRIVPVRTLRRSPSITVVIPCYNYGRFLPTVVYSALGQTGVDAHIVIVDDASTDGSADVAREIAKVESRVRVVVHEENVGHIRTFNDGLRLVDTEYVTLVSADDVVAPGALARACALMEAHPRVGLVHGKTVWFSTEDDMHPTGLSFLQVWTIWRGEEWIERAAREGRNPVMSPEAVMRTDALRSVGEYDPRMLHTSDLDMWLRTAARWDVGWIRGSVQAYYRMHGGNMHVVDHGSEAKNLSGLLDAFETLVSPDVVSVLPRGPELLQIARTAIGMRAIETAERESQTAGASDLAAVALRAVPALVDRASAVGGPAGAGG